MEEPGVAIATPSVIPACRVTIPPGFFRAIEGPDDNPFPTGEAGYGFACNPPDPWDCKWRLSALALLFQTIQPRRPGIAMGENSVVGNHQDLLVGRIAWPHRQSRSVG